MSRYDYRSLSSQDFEDLTRDLLQEEWKTTLEAFRSGRDGGIDLRYIHTNRGTTIIQCKHYISSGYRRLFQHLRKDELPKVRQLKPVRYVLVTTVDLTPNNKKTISNLFHPYIHSEADIIGSKDVDGLLSQHPRIERKNFKLWLTNTAVLERVLHNAEACHTDFEVERIQQKLPIFVQSDAFPRAEELLEKERIVIISGVPGIGKTTLAETLLYSHLANGYEPVVIQAEVAEGRKFFNPNKKQVFYYDDFLGQTFLGDRGGYLTRNQDVALVNFMEMVNRSKQSRFILTTREHILSAALQASERLAQSSILQRKCVLELKDYSYAQKARILYNHLYFSGLESSYKEAVLANDFFLKIIKHDNYNPRIIEWLSSYTRLQGVTPDNYQAHISTLLSAPEHIWEHAYRTQISDAARHLLLCSYTLGQWVDVIDLEEPFISLHGYFAKKYNMSVAPGDFRRSLQELDGAFLSYRTSHVSFINPSVREFVSSVILRSKEITENLIKSAVRFSQIDSLWELSSAYPDSELTSFLRSNVDLVFEATTRLLNGETMRWETTDDGRKRFGYPIDLGEENKIRVLVKMCGVLQSIRFLDLIRQLVAKMIDEWKMYSPNFSSLMYLLKDITSNTWFLNNGGRRMVQDLLDAAFENLGSARAEDWEAILTFARSSPDWVRDYDRRLDTAIKEYCDSGVYDDKSERNDLDELNGLLGSLIEIRKEFGIDLNHAIQHLNEDISERKEAGKHATESSFSRNWEDYQKEFTSDDDIREMFKTLNEKK